MNFSKSQFQNQNQNAKSQSTNKCTPKKRKLSKEANSTKAKYFNTNKGIKEVEDFRYDMQNFMSFIEQIPKSNCHYCTRILFANEEDPRIYKLHSLWQVPVFLKSWYCSTTLSIHKQLGIIPPELEGLNVMEKRHISKIHFYLTIVIIPGGQYGEKGQSIHFPVEISETCKNLPKPVENSVIIFIKSNNSSDVAYPVSYHKVYNALHWLKQNNILYKDINIINSLSIEVRPCTDTDSWPDSWPDVTKCI